MLEGLTDDKAVGAVERAHCRARRCTLVILKGIALSGEANMDNFGAVAGEEGMVAGRIKDGPFYHVAHVIEVLAGECSHSHIENTPGEHGTGPVAAFDLADVEVERVAEARIVVMAAFLCVHPPLQQVQRLEQGDGRFDGVGARTCIGDMSRQTLQAHLNPDHPNLRRHELFGQGLRNQCRISAIAALQAGQSAVAGAIFLHNRLKEFVGCRVPTEMLQRLDCKEIRGQTGLHVTRAAATHPVAIDMGVEGRAFPHVQRAGRHHVDMPVEDETAPALAAAAQSSHRVVVVADHRREPWQPRDVGDIYLPAVDLITKSAKLACDETLGGLLLPPR